MLGGVHRAMSSERGAFTEGAAGSAAPSVRAASAGAARAPSSRAASAGAVRAPSSRAASAGAGRAPSSGAASAGALQTRGSAVIQVTEATGIRRTEYPVNARIQLPKGALADAAHARLRLNDADQPAQCSAESRWDDGSVQWLDVDFNVSLGPSESRSYQLEYGPDVSSGTAPRGLTVTENADSIQVGNVKFNRSGAPLILSASYRGELIGQGQNGLAITDSSGARHDLSTAQSLRVDVVKGGPLDVVVRYSGRIPVDGTYAVPFTLTCEMPNSKSWVRTTAVLEDPAARVKDIVFETPLAFGEKPWMWDFSTENGTYGVFRNATDAALLTQTVNADGASRWTVQTGTQAELRAYESSTPSRTRVAAGWGHILDAKAAVAFAIDRFATEAGTYTISLNGQGQAAFRFAPAEGKAQRRLAVYEHFVATPVPIGAATSPTAMVYPLVVSVK
jgi:hypothetical protein